MNTEKHILIARFSLYLDPDDIIESLRKAAEQIINAAAVWISEKGSGWTIEEVQSEFVNLTKYQPLRGRSHIQLPKELRNSMMGLINLQNQDDKCFLWCLVRHLNPRKKNPQRITKDDMQFAKKLDFSGITFPVTRNQISRIEKQNKIYINVYGYDTSRKYFYPIYPTKPHNVDPNKIINLLHIEDEINGKITDHFVYIKDINRLLSNFTKHKGKKQFCLSCLQCFYSSDSLARHRNYSVYCNKWNTSSCYA